MRLSSRQQHVLRQTLQRRFGADARLWVFGSRVDNKARGGDVDLMVQTNATDPHQLVAARLHFLADLQGTLEFEGEKIDLVLLAPCLGARPDTPGAPSPLLPVQRVALAEGIELT